MIPTRRCSRSGCGRRAVATLTYDYAASTAVLGPLSGEHQPGTYDLCAEHAAALSVPRGWEVIRLAHDPDPAPSRDDLEALADAVREAAARVDPLPPVAPAAVAGPGRDVVEVARRGHLTVLADVDNRRR